MHSLPPSANNTDIFVVDEYQDVSPLQQRLLDAWLGERDDLCVVGDASQTIYSFTGATSRHLLEFPRRYRGSHTVRLTRDYRSHSQVVELANRLLAARRPRPDSTEFSWAPPAQTHFPARTGESKANGSDIRMTNVKPKALPNKSKISSKKMAFRHQKSRCFSALRAVRASGGGARPIAVFRISYAELSNSSIVPRSSKRCLPCERRQINGRFRERAPLCA